MFKRTLIAILSGVLLCQMPGVNSLDAQDTTLRLQQNLLRVKKWLGPGSNSEGWRRYLNLGDLESQTAMGLQADSTKLQQILDRFNQDADGLDHPHFSQLAVSISDQIEAISSAQSFGSPNIADLDELYQPISDERLETNKTILLDELYLLKIYINQNLWGIDRPRARRDLQIDELLELLDSIDFTDHSEEYPGDERFDIRQRKILAVARKLRELKPAYRIQASQQENLHIQIVEKELEFFENLCTFAFNDEATEQNYTRNLEEFNENLLKLSDLSDQSAQLAVSQGIGRIRRLGQSEAWLGAIRREYSKPNFQIAVTESLLNRLAKIEPVRDRRWIDQVVLGNLSLIHI